MFLSCMTQLQVLRLYGVCSRTEPLLIVCEYLPLGVLCVNDARGLASESAAVYWPDLVLSQF
jgi:hypothetical protein